MTHTPAGRQDTKTFHATWLANVAGEDGTGRPAYARIADSSPYRPEDPFVVGWDEHVEATAEEDVPEIMWSRHNNMGRPSGRTCRSMCTGDVVMVDGTAYACESFGFRRLEVPPSRIEDGNYVDYVTARNPAVKPERSR